MTADMSTFFRHFTHIALVISLGLFGAQLRADASAGPMMTMVICASDGPVEVQIDRNGNPVTPQSPCCDCVACAVTAIAGDANFSGVIAPTRFSTLDASLTRRMPSKSQTLLPQARGPPSTMQLSDAFARGVCGLPSKDATV